MFYFISTLLLTGFWFLLSDGDLTSLLVGVVFIPLSIFVSAKLSDKVYIAHSGLHIKLLQVPKFILFFIYQSIKGGVSTAQRAFSFNMHLQPGFIHYSVKHLPAGSPMNLFVNVVSLLPGSVSVVREPNSLLVHVLIVTNSSLNELYECEQAICELYGLDTSSHDINSLTTKAS